MHIVIDIDEWVYKSICEGVAASKRCGVPTQEPAIDEAIANGTPLPTEEKIDKAIKEIKDNRAEIACLFDDDWDRGIEAILEILNKLK